MQRMIALTVLGVAMALGPPARGDFDFSTGDPDGKMAMASRPGAGGKAEIEAADDFVTTAQKTAITTATFTGLITSETGAAPRIDNVVVEIYRVFPNDSTVPPSGNVPTRNNSPSDVAFTTRDAAGGGLSFTTTTLSNSITAANSVLNGIFPKPNQTTLGEGPVTGTEVKFNVTFNAPLNLHADHYFFVPQVQVDGGEFYWLSAPKPIVAPGTPFPPDSTDLQAWIRNAALQPDWLRVGTDIVGGATPPQFNGAFSLQGKTVPEPASLALLAVGLAAAAAARRRLRRP